MRSATWLTVTLSLAPLGACSNAVLPGPPEWNRTVVPPTDDVAQSQRAACAYTAGALPAETQGLSHPVGKDIPIDHFVIMMMENRSFDHYFQKLPDSGITDVEVAPSTFTNPDLNGDPVAPTRDTQRCFVDTDHGWNSVHRQINGGKMDGFFVTNDGTHETPLPNMTLDMLSGKRGMGYYTGEDLPFAYWVASQFSIGDHYHASVPGPTWPNRMYMYAATSRGRTANLPQLDNPNIIVDELEKRKITWAVYMTGKLPGLGVITDRFLYYYSGEGAGTGDNLHVRTIDDFYAEAAAGTLPQVVFVDPAIGDENPGQNDEHPPAVMQIGQRLVAQVTDAIIKSPNWSHTAMFVNYDEHGGLFDHVVPPKACPPDDFAPELTTTDEKGGFDELGVRVPFMVISPFAKSRFVGHHTYDHTSVLRLVEARFVMPALSNRDANAEAPWEMFDFVNPPNKTPPAPPIPTVDDAQIAACLTTFGK